MCRKIRTLQGSVKQVLLRRKAEQLAAGNQRMSDRHKKCNCTAKRTSTRAQHSRSHKVQGSADTSEHRLHGRKGDAENAGARADRSRCTHAIDRLHKVNKVATHARAISQSHTRSTQSKQQGGMRIQSAGGRAGKQAGQQGSRGKRRWLDVC